MSSAFRSFVQLFRDLMVVGVLLAGINIFTARNDLGWLTLNPTPWILLPALIGLRYGVVSGLAAGLLGGGVIAIANVSVFEAHNFAQRHSYFFSTLLLTGYLAGQAQRLLSRENERLKAVKGKNDDEIQRLRAEVGLLRESRQELQRGMALHHMSMASLDDDLRRVIGAADDESAMFERLLHVFHQHTKVVSAAFYFRSGGQLQRVAALHPTSHLSEQLALAEAPLARRALEEHALVSVEAAEASGSSQPFLAALPFEYGKGEGVLLIEDMPLETFDWPHLARLELMLQWVLALARYRQEMGAAGRDLAPPSSFRSAVESALIAEQTYQVPSVAIRADFANREEATSAKVRRRLLKALPATSVATQLSDGGSLVVLLPFAGETEATVLTREWQNSGIVLRVSHFLVGGTAKLDEFWDHLAKS